MKGKQYIIFFSLETENNVPSRKHLFFGINFIIIDLMNTLKRGLSPTSNPMIDDNHPNVSQKKDIFCLKT